MANPKGAVLTERDRALLAFVGIAGTTLLLNDVVAGLDFLDLTLAAAAPPVPVASSLTTR